MLALGDEELRTPQLTSTCSVSLWSRGRQDERSRYKSSSNLVKRGKWESKRYNLGSQQEWRRSGVFRFKQTQRILAKVESDSYE